MSEVVEIKGSESLLVIFAEGAYKLNYAMMPPPPKKKRRKKKKHSHC